MNNYEYIEKLKNSEEEQIRIKRQLEKIINIVLMTEEEKEQLIENTFNDAIKSYTPTTALAFFPYIKNKLKKEIEKTYFTPSLIIPLEEQKIINLILSKQNNRFLTEEEIRIRLETYSGKLYQTIYKLENPTPKMNKELETIFPNYKQRLKERKKYFKQPIELTEKDLEYLGYYIGEIDYICLDIHEIARKENKSDAEIKKKLESIFNLLKDEKNLQLVKVRYPNCESMLQIKATNFGVKLKISEPKKEPSIKTIEKPQKVKKAKTTPIKENKKKEETKTIPVKKQVQSQTLSKEEIDLLKELQKYPSDNILIYEVAKNLNLDPIEVSNKIQGLKRKYKRNSHQKEIESYIPNFLNLKGKKGRNANTVLSKKEILLKENQEMLLRELAKNPSISRRELAKITGYKNEKCVYQIINLLKKRCQNDPRVEKKVLELYPDFLKKIEKPKKVIEKKTPALTEVQKNLLKALNNDGTLLPTLKKIRSHTSYNSRKLINNKIEVIKKKSEETESIKAEVLELFPTFFEQEKYISSFTDEQQKLLVLLNKGQLIDKKELATILDYQSIHSTDKLWKRLKELVEKNEEAKQEALTICPEFLKQETILTPSKEKQKKKIEKKNPTLTEVQKNLLKALNSDGTLLPTLKKIRSHTSYNSRELINNKIEVIKKKSEKTASIKAEVLELFPTFFEQEKYISSFTDEQQKLLVLLNKSQLIDKKELATILDYQNIQSTDKLWKRLKELVEKNEEAKQEALTICPEFLKQETIFQEQEPLQKKYLTSRQEKLLEKLNENKDSPLTKKQLAKEVGYSSEDAVYNAITLLKKRCQENEEIKKEALQIYKELLETSPGLKNKELELLHDLYLITPPETTYTPQKELSKKFNCSAVNLSIIKSNVLKKIETSPKIQEDLQKTWPTFEQDKAIKEQYKKTRSVKIPSENLEGIKTFIRQFDIPETTPRIEKKQNPIVKGIKNLENSIFNPYVSQCTEEQKAILALRLGFINAPLQTEHVAELFGIEKEEVITLTKNCLQSAINSSSEKQVPKTYEKKN